MLRDMRDRLLRDKGWCETRGGADVTARGRQPDATEGHDRLRAMADPVSYRLRPALGARMIGMACVWLGLAVVLEVVRRAVPVLDVLAVQFLEWFLVAIFAVLAGWGAWIVFGRRPRLVLDDEGFLNHTNRLRDSVRAAAWRDVSDVRRRDTLTGTVLVLELADGRQSVITSRLLDVAVPELEEQIRERLNAAHGYRPL